MKVRLKANAVRSQAKPVQSETQTVVGWDALECLHARNCTSKDSREIQMRQVVFQGVNIVEFDAYCFECDRFLYHYNQGRCEV